MDGRSCGHRCMGIAILYNDKAALIGHALILLFGKSYV